MNKSTFVALISAISLFGCAAPPEVQQMVINDGIDISALKAKGIEFKSIKVTGGGNTEFIMGSRVEKAGVEEALNQTLSKLNLINKSNGTYGLDVNLRNCSAPIAGFVLDVNCQFEYKVVFKSGEVKEMLVESVGSANSFDGFNQYHLILRKANEKAVRENIKKFLVDINAFYK